LELDYDYDFDFLSQRCRNTHFCRSRTTFLH
jgi:hypothetical protein